MSSVTRLPTPGELPEVLPGDDAAGQPGEEELDRLGLGRVGGGLAAVRFHQRPGSVELRLGEGGEGILDVALHDRLDVAVGDDGAAPLVLPPDRRDLMRQGDRHVREARFQELAQPQLVGRVDVGEEETDGDGDVALGIVRDALARRDSARSSSASSVRGMSVRPWKSSRSATPRQLRRSTSGRGLVHFSEK